MLSWNPTFLVVFRWNMKCCRVGLQKAWMLIDLEITPVPCSLDWTLEGIDKIFNKICSVTLEQILSAIFSCNGVSIRDLINHSAYDFRLKKEMSRTMGKNFRVWHRCSLISNSTFKRLQNSPIMISTMLVKYYMIERLLKSNHKKFETTIISQKNKPYTDKLYNLVYIFNHHSL